MTFQVTVPAIPQHLNEEQFAAFRQELVTSLAAQLRDAIAEGADPEVFFERWESAAIDAGHSDELRQETLRAGWAEFSQGE